MATNTNRHNTLWISDPYDWRRNVYIGVMHWCVRVSNEIGVHVYLAGSQCDICDGHTYTVRSVRWNARRPNVTRASVHEATKQRQKERRDKLWREKKKSKSTGHMYKCKTRDIFLLAQFQPVWKKSFWNCLNVDGFHGWKMAHLLDFLVNFCRFGGGRMRNGSHHTLIIFEGFICLEKFIGSFHCLLDEGADFSYVTWIKILCAKWKMLL